VLEIANTGRPFGGCDRSARPGTASADDDVLFKLVVAEAGFEHHLRAFALLACSAIAALAATAGGGDSGAAIAGREAAVGDAEVVDLFVDALHGEYGAGDEGGDVVEPEVVHRRSVGKDRGKSPVALVVMIMHVVGDDVVDAVAAAARGFAACMRE